MVLNRHCDDVRDLLYQGAISLWDLPLSSKAMKAFEPTLIGTSSFDEGVTSLASREDVLAFAHGKVLELFRVGLSRSSALDVSMVCCLCD